MEGSGAPWGCRTQSALREGLLDLIQHIPKQRRLVTFSVNGHGLTGLGGGGKQREKNQGHDLKVHKNWLRKYQSQRIMREKFHWFTHSFDQQTDVVTLDRPAVHGGTGVDPLHN